jgi:hypothetical protein
VVMGMIFDVNLEDKFNGNPSGGKP